MDPHGYTAGFQRPGTLLVMRHPETTANDGHRLIGQLEVPLTARGDAQRQRAVEAVAAWNPDRILTSPLSRCRGIAEGAGKILGLDPICDKGLIEMNFGAIEDLTAEEVIERGLCFPWGETQDRWPVEGAESMEDFMCRTADAARRLSRLTGRSAVISHGGAIRGFLAAWLGIPQERFWQLSIGNVTSCLIEFDEEGNAFLESFGLTPEQVILSRRG